MSRAHLWPGGPVACLLLMVGIGCGGDEKDGVALILSAQWKDNPGSVADVGYHVRATLRWIDRLGTCARIPTALRVTINELEATRTGARAACEVDGILDAGPFTTADPIAVHAFDGNRSIGEAAFEQAFWGMQAALISPSDGQVRAGDQVVVSIPPGRAPPPIDHSTWYWLGTAPSVPPFYTSSGAQLSADNATFTVTVPDMKGLSGPVALIINPVGDESVSPLTCTGFVDCSLFAQPAPGPIALTVLAP